MNLYERVYDLCQEKGLSGRELGDKLNLKKSPLTDWKNNKARPTLEQIEKMCEIFAISSEYLIFGKESKELSSEEQELLEAYRAVPPEIKKIVKATLEIGRPKQDESSSSRTG